MNHDQPIIASPAELAVERPAAVGKVLGLVGFTFLFTAGGAALGMTIGPAGILVGMLGGFPTLFALLALREKTPINLGLLYAFGLCEGLTLGSLLDSYLTKGLGEVVLLAGLATVIATVVAGAYGATTQRDFSGLGDLLFVGLLSILGLSLVAILLQAPVMSVGVAGIAAVLFTAYIVYDLNAAARARGITEGAEILLAVNVYLDILNLFLNLLRILVAILGSSDD